MLRLSIALACTVLAVLWCKKKDAVPADAGARVSVPVAPAPLPAPPGAPIVPPAHKTSPVPPTGVPKTTLTTPPSTNVVPPAPHPKHKGAPTPGEAISDPEDVE